MSEDKIKKPKKLALVKCPHCKESVDRNTEEFQEHNKRYYHQDCFDFKHGEVIERDALHTYINILKGTKFPSSHILRQIKEFQEPPFNYTLRGMLTTLKFMYEVEGVTEKGDNTGIGLIEYYYNKAREHHTNLINISESVTNETFKTEKKIVRTAPPKPRVIDLIDIGGL